MKKSQMLVGLALAAMSALSLAPAQAEPANGEVLISQLRGHNLEDPIEVFREDWLKFKFEDFAIGRIRGVTGDIAQVEILAPSSVEIGDSKVWRVTTRLPRLWPTLVAGNDVIMRVEDGEWKIISDDVEEFSVLYHYAKPNWVSRLDLKEVALIERTAIDWSRPDVTLPPLAPSTAVIEPVEQEPPVRGMW